MKAFKKSNKKIVFILCSVRSGSTLLKNMLDQHTDIFAPSELHILPFEKLDHMKVNFRGSTLAKGLLEAIVKLKACTTEEAQVIFDFFKDNDYTSQDIYDWFLSNIDQTYLIDKSPTYGMNYKVLPKIHDLNNEVLFIHLMRHPLAVMKSVVKNNFDKTGRLLSINAKRAMEMVGEDSNSEFLYFDTEKMVREKNPVKIAEISWTHTNKNIADFLDSISNDKKIQIFYEDLMAQPIRSLKKICCFLDVPYQSTMLMPQGIFSNVSETVGDPNFFKRNEIQNQNLFKISDLLENGWSISPQTIDLAIKHNYLCWESEKALGLLPAEKAFFQNNKHYNDHCLVTSFEAENVQKFDESKLSRSLAEIMIENPNLSSVFVNTNNEWKRHLINDAQVQITRIFCKPNDDQNKMLDDYTNLWIEGLDITQGSLLTMFYVYQNKKLTVRYVIHHLLMDGSSLMKFHRQLWSMYSKVPMGLAKKENRGNIENYIEYCQGDSESNLDTVVDTEHRNKPFVQALSYGEQSEYRTTITKDDLNKSKLHFNELACTLYTNLGTLLGETEITIAHRFHNRNSEIGSTKNLFAWLASDAPITMNVDIEKEALMDKFKYEKKRVVKDNISFQLCKNNIKFQKYCQARFNYIPIRMKTDSNEITFQKYESTLTFDPRNEREYVMDFIVRESRESFEVIVRFFEKEFSSSSIKEFVSHWKEAFLAFNEMALLHNT